MPTYSSPFHFPSQDLDWSCGSPIGMCIHVAIPKCFAPFKFAPIESDINPGMRTVIYELFMNTISNRMKEIMTDSLPV